MRRVVPSSLLLAALAAAPAQAQEASVLRLSAEPGHTVLRGDELRVRGALQPAAAGREVVVRVFGADGRKRAARKGTTNSAGVLRVTLPPLGVGAYEVRAAGSGPMRLRVLPRRVRPGSSPRAIRALQTRLDALGYVVGRRGVLDARTARAVLAFRKVTRMARTTSADEAVMRRLAKGGGRFRVRFPGHGRHVEADISRQVLALIGEGGEVERIYPTSTGAPATPTIRGSFRVYRKDPGTNALGMVHSAYFIRGYAIHGFRSVPTYNASHGCLRVPVPDALSIFRWVRMGTRVDTYV